MDLSQLFKTTSFSSEAEELLQSLPRHNACGDKLCLYKGFWFLPCYLNPTLLSQKKFHAKDSDVVVATLPKSGTTWLKSLVFAITKRAQYPISDPTHPLHTSSSHDLVPYFEFIYSENENPDFSHLPSPRLFSTHNAYNVLPESVKATSKSRIIYLCRDLKDTFVSSWHFLNEIAVQGTEDQKTNPIEEAFELFCKGITMQGPTWDHVLGYWNASLKEPEKVLFLRYEDLMGDTVSQVKRIADFLGFPFSAKEESEGVVEEIVKMCSFESLRNLKANTSEGKRYLPFVENTVFFRKGEVRDWVNYLTPSMAKQLDQIVEQKLQGSGLKLN